MSNTNNIQLRGIEILKTSIDYPNIPNFSVKNYNYDIKVDNNVDRVNNVIFCIVSIVIKGDDNKLVLGSIAVSNIFHIPALSKFIPKNIEDKPNIPAELTNLLNSIAVNTTRGVMFNTFKGTFLHNAFLPVVEQIEL